MAPPKEPVLSDMLDWQICRAARTPGPGAYKIPSTIEFNGGRWGKAISKTSIDWVIHAAKQSPGPGAYKLPDGSDLISGGRMSKGTPKTDLDWAVLRAKNQPGPGEYVIPSTLSTTGGVMTKGNSKSGLDWEIRRANQIPAPHDYNTDQAWSYLDGTNGRRGAVMLGRNGPAKMPAPYAQFSSEGSAGYRGDPSASHATACTPWRDHENWALVAKSGSSPDITGPSEPPSFGEGDTMTDEQKLMFAGKELEDGRMALAPAPAPEMSVEGGSTLVMHHNQLSARPQSASSERSTHSDQAAGSSSKNTASITTPWRNSDQWRRVVRVPGEAERAPATAGALLLNGSCSGGGGVRRACLAGSRRTAPRLASRTQQIAVVAPWRDPSWRKVARDPKADREANLAELPETDFEKANERIKTPWRDQEGWSKAARKQSIKPEAPPSCPPPAHPHPAHTTAPPARPRSAPGVEVRANHSRPGSAAATARKGPALDLCAATSHVPRQQRRQQRQQQRAAPAAAGMLWAAPPAGGAAAAPTQLRRPPPAVVAVDYAAELRRLYSEYNPSKTSEISDLLSTYAGKEELLLQAVKLKYAADSHTTPLHPTTLIKADPLLVHKGCNGGWACDACFARNEPVLYHGEPAESGGEAFDMCRACVLKERASM